MIQDIEHLGSRSNVEHRKAIGGFLKECRMSPQGCRTPTVRVLCWDNFWVTLGSFWDHFGITLGSFWGHFGITLGSLWHHFGITSGSLWGHFGITLGSLLDHFGVTLGSFWDHVGIIGAILGSFWEAKVVPATNNDDKPRYLPTTPWEERQTKACQRT